MGSNLLESSPRLSRSRSGSTSHSPITQGSLDLGPGPLPVEKSPSDDDPKLTLSPSFSPGQDIEAADHRDSTVLERLPHQDLPAT